jgi:hypothetical protein
MASIVDIIINATDNATRQIDQVQRAIERVGQHGGRLQAIMTGATGSIAALAPALAGLGGLSSMFASAGIGAAAFGAVAVSSIGGVIEAGEEVARIEEKIAMADTAEERAAANAELARVMGSLSTAQKGALADLQGFQSWWGTFKTQFDPQVFNVFSQGLDLIRNTMTALQPAITTVGTVLGDFMEKMNGAFKTDQVQGWFEYINSSVGGSLTAILTSAGNLFSGFMNLLVAFAPVAASMESGMIGLTASFESWSASLSSSQGFQNFMNYAKANTPVVMGLISNLWSFIVQLVAALAPLGSVILNVAAGFAQWLATSGTMSTVLNAISAAGQFLMQNLGAVKTVLAGVLAGFIAFKAIMFIVSIVRIIITVFNVLKTVFNVIRTAFMAVRIAMMLFPGTWLVAAIMAVIAAIVWLALNWDTAKAAIMRFWEACKTAFSNFGTMISNAMTTAGTAVSNGVTAIVNWFVQMGSRIVSAVSSFGSAVATWFTNMMTRAATAVSNGITRVVTFFTQLGSRVSSTISSLASRVATFFSNMMSRASSAVSSGVSKVVSFFSRLQSQVQSKISSLASRVMSLFTQMMSRAASAVSSGISKVISFFTKLGSQVISTITSIASKMVSSFTSMMSRAASAVSSGVSRIVSSIKGFAGSFLSAGKGLLDAFTSGIKSGISKAVGAVSAGMSKIRSFLPFSPAKKGALSDLDKSGESFFPTWYNGALKKVRPMTRAIGGALDSVNSQLQREQGNLNLGVGLESFNGGRATITVRHRINHEGTVRVQGDSSRETVRTVASSVDEEVTGFTLDELRQAVRKR